MYDQRKDLPVFGYHDQLCQTIASSRVTVVRGATGCGKTTQIPQFILDEFVGYGKGAECGIIVTQVFHLNYNNDISIYFFFS